MIPTMCKRVLSSLMAVVSVLHLFSGAGCSKSVEDKSATVKEDKPAKVKAERVPTAEEAKDALAKMLDTKLNGKDPDPGSEIGRADLTQVQQERTFREDDGVIFIGQWRCRLLERQFDKYIETERSILWLMGHFELLPDGQWKAVIDGSSCFKLR